MRLRRRTRGRAEIEAFLQRYVGNGIQMEVEDILVNGPPWNTRVAVVVHDWVARPERRRRRTRTARSCSSAPAGARLVTHEDFEDTERAAAFDAYAPA